MQAPTFQDDNYGSKLLWCKGQRLGTKSISKIIKKVWQRKHCLTTTRVSQITVQESIQKQRDAVIQDTEIVQRTRHKNV